MNVPDVSVDDVLANLVANAVSTSISTLARSKFLSKRKGKRASVPTNLSAVVSTALVRLAKQKPSGRLSDSWLRFLSSPDAESIVRQLFAAVVLRKRLGDHEDELWTLFEQTATGFTQREYDATLSRELFDRAVALVSETLTVLASHGAQFAAEAGANYRHRILMAEIKAIQSRLADDQGKKSIATEALTVLLALREQVRNKHAHITPPNFDSALRIPIRDIYVAPSLEFVASVGVVRGEPLDLHRFASKAFRNVVLGHPGGGKSTLLSRLCWEMAATPEQRIFGGRDIVPVVVILRDYGSSRRSEGSSILDFIVRTIRTRYQLACTPQIIGHLLQIGAAMVFFDGLDELLDTTYRQEVRDDVEQFCNLFPAAPVLVTSREVGYDFAPLEERVFTSYRLLPLNDAQVAEYAHKWFALDRDLISEAAKTKADAFLSESQGIPDLRTNPLMLGLLCNIYRGESYLPKNRPDVYEKCATMLFERWDKQRGIGIALPFEAHVGPAMRFLAHWIYTTPDLQSGVTEQQLIKNAAEYLEKWRFEDHEEALKASRDFIELCRGRAWVFTDIGTTADGERLYQFTHRTFLEYFAASYIVRTDAAPDKLAAHLIPRIRRGEWDMVAQLAFQLDAKTIEGAAEDLLGAVADATRQEHEGRERLALATFAVRCMSFLVPRPSVIRVAMSAALEAIVDVVSSTMSEEEPASQDFNEQFELFKGIAAENTRPALEAAVTTLVGIVHGGDVRRQRIALGISALLPIYGPLPNGLADWRRDVEREVSTQCEAEWEAAAGEYLDVATMWMWQSPGRLRKVIYAHGLEGLFKRPVSPLGVHFSPMASALSWRFSTGRRRLIEPLDLDSLAEFGAIVEQTAPPWMSSQAIGLAWKEDWRWFVDRRVRDGVCELRADGTAAFGLLAIQMVIAEIAQSHGAEILLEQRQASDILLVLLGARVSSNVDSSLAGVLDKASLSQNQRQFVQEWCEGKITLISSA